MQFIFISYSLVWHKYQVNFKFNGDFKICNTEDDGCTVETCLKIKESCYVYTS